MIIPNNVYEVVTRNEIEDQETHLRDALIGVSNIYARLRQQRANDALLEVVFELRHKVEEGLKDIQKIRECFPPTPAPPL